MKGSVPYTARLARVALRLAGWRLVGRAPDVRQCIVIFAPHTSNWDLPIMLLVREAFGNRVSYLAKHTLFRFPFGWLFRWTGGIPVERAHHHHLVSDLARLFADNPELWLALAPEGTRSWTDHWKSGFYQLALETRVPVLCAFLDAPKRECGLGVLLHLTGEVEADLARLREFYGSKHGIVPELASEIRFQDHEQCVPTA
jgi:1-acyl-sn-glycerol-3-phosphate acyltransferase